MEMIRQFSEFFRHLDAHFHGPWLYLVLFLIIFCETGLVVTPVLPGDSLLFAMGALAANNDSPLSLPLLLILLIGAAILGDAVNYVIGYRAGPRVFQSEHSRLFNRKHLVRTQEFYEKYGNKTIVLARFVPIVRTFAPFVAGIARMGYFRFWQFNCVGGAAWVAIFLLGGYYFGNIPMIKTNFHIVIVAIVLISVVPMGLEWVAVRRRAARSIAPAVPTEGSAEPFEAER